MDRRWITGHTVQAGSGVFRCDLHESPSSVEVLSNVNHPRPHLGSTWYRTVRLCGIRWCFLSDGWLARSLSRNNTALASVSRSVYFLYRSFGHLLKLLLELRCQVSVRWIRSRVSRVWRRAHLLRDRPLTGPIKLLSLGFVCPLGVHHCQNLRRRLADYRASSSALSPFFEEDLQLVVFSFSFVTVLLPFLEARSTSCTTASSFCLCLRRLYLNIVPSDFFIGGAAVGEFPEGHFS